MTIKIRAGMMAACACLAFVVHADADIPAIPMGAPVVVDGVAAPGEWEDAASATIEVADGWVVPVRFKQDEDNLYVRFSNLKHADGSELYPEVLVDASASAAMQWGPGQWWFHASYSNCEGHGAFNAYDSCRIGPKPGWNANNFPLAAGGEVEFAIAKRGLSIDRGDPVGLAFDVTDTQSRWHFHPAGARLEAPGTWRRYRW